jgi:hypothetical protein
MHSRFLKNVVSPIASPKLAEAHIKTKNEQNIPLEQVTQGARKTDQPKSTRSPHKSPRNSGRAAKNFQKPKVGGDSHFFYSGYWHLRNWLYMRPVAIFTPPERFFVNRTFSLTCRHRLFGHLMIAHHGYVLEIFTHHR